MRQAVLLLVLASASAPATAGQSRIPLILEGAYRQVGVTVHYDGSYQRIPFPGGDIPLERGVCTDVIVRAYRHAGVDLQVLVNRDMSQAFRAYPRRWGLTRPDPNIDHRRVANLATFFRRNGQALPVSSRARDYTAGDIVTWRLPSGADHIGFVTHRLQDERPLVVHNIGGGTRVEDVLFSYEIIGHYRYAP